MPLITLVESNDDEREMEQLHPTPLQVKLSKTFRAQDNLHEEVV